PRASRVSRACSTHVRRECPGRMAIRECLTLRGRNVPRAAPLFTGGGPGRSRTGLSAFRKWSTGVGDGCETREETLGGAHLLGRERRAAVGERAVPGREPGDRGAD